MAMAGRPKSDVPTVGMCLKLTEKERYDLRVIAANKGVAINDVIREWIKQEKAKQTVKE